MDSLIPNLFILTTEASIIFAIIIGILIFFHQKAKKNDFSSVTQLVEDIKENEAFRVKLLAVNLKKNQYSGNCEDKAKELHTLEKSFLQEFLNVYLKRDIFRLDNLPPSLIELTDEFILPSTANGDNNGVPQAQTAAAVSVDEPQSENKILAEAQAIKEEHLKEINALRLKNTEVNESLFEALETITGLVTEHSKNNGGSDKPSAQQILDAILYLKDQREKLSSPVEESNQKDTNEANTDETIFNETVPDLGITDILKTDLESDLDHTSESSDAVKDKSIPKEDIDNTIVGESDPWADALAEQSEAETAQTDATPEPAEEADPWADALAEQSEAEAAQTDATPEPAEEADPWADALAEQSEAEAAQTGATPEPAEEADPWADALAEQSEAEVAQTDAAPEPAEEADPWADALAEQSEAEAAQTDATPEPAEKADPWADALAEQSEAEAAQTDATPEPAEEADPWADALAEQSEAEAAQTTTTSEPTEEADPWADALAEQSEAEAAQTTTTSEPTEEADPWADALAEQSEAEGKS